MGSQDDVMVKPGLAIPRAELTFRASRSGGPGGQHVNTSSTRIELIWNVAQSAALSSDQRAWLLRRLATRLDGEGNLRLVAQDERSQLRNREAAVERFIEVVKAALKVPKRRKPTRVPVSAVRARLDAKRRQSERKRQRRTLEE